MSANSLRTLARHLDVPERTLRRAAAEGLVRGDRTSARRFLTTLREETYLRTHWPLLSSLREALRTEPNVRLAILFGSQATGASLESSDVDVLVALADPSAANLAELTGRLERRIGRDIQLVRIEDAERAPVLMSAALSEGRVLVDPEARWPELKASEPRWRRRAAAGEIPLEDAMPTAEQVHEAARIVADEFIPFYDAYRAWIGRGFAAAVPAYDHRSHFATLLRRPWPSRSRSSRTRARASAAPTTRSRRRPSTPARSATSRDSRTGSARTAASTAVPRSWTCTPTTTTTSTEPERRWPLTS